MKILSLEAENFMRLRIVRIDSQGRNLVQITGKNGSGKTSILNAIYAALAGAKGAPVKPIREGAESAIIRLDLGEVTVTRRFTKKSTSLIVEAADGSRFPNPQSMLDSLLGAMSFDPLEFSRLKSREQLEQLRSLVNLDVDLDALDRANEGDYNARTLYNRDVKSIQARLDATPAITQLPEQPADVTALLEQLEMANDLNKQTALENAAIASKNTQIQVLANNIDSFKRDIGRLQKEIAAKQGQIAEAGAQKAALEAEVANASRGEEIDTAWLRQEIAQAQDQQCVYDAHKQAMDARANLSRELEAAKAKSEQCTKNIELRDERKRTAIASAKMPVEGLGFGDGEVLWNGLPLSQASDAEQLRISVAIAMQMNPKLRVLRIRDGSLLDSNSMKLLEDMLDAEDYQAWVERVEEDGKVGVVMEDGSVKESDYGPDAFEMEGR
jgi:DNA repair exonuclease SbcCD ATPase subunit